MFFLPHLAVFGLFLPFSRAFLSEELVRQQAQNQPEPVQEPISKVPNLYDHEDIALKTIEGEERLLSEYRGRVLLIANVASE